MRLLPWRPQGWTVDDVHLLSRGDGCKYELIDGALWVEPPPPPEHARVIERLAGVLAQAAAETDLRVAAWRLAATTAQVQIQPDVVLGNRTRLRPDVVVVAEPAGRPDASAISLVVEITEQATQLVDRSLRSVLWSDVGLTHFWRLELDPLLLVAHVLDGEEYRETGRFVDEVRIDEPFQLRFRLTDLVA
jgi:Uma2 family endonuclease